MSALRISVADDEPDMRDYYQRMFPTESLARRGNSESSSPFEMRRTSNLDGVRFEPSEREV